MPKPEAVKKYHRILGITKRNIISGDRETIRLYINISNCPRFEYCFETWNPFFRKGLETLEKVQRKVTKMIKGCRRLNYEDRLKHCGLTTLEKRKVRDLIVIDRILTLLSEVPYDSFFYLHSATGSLLEDTKKIIKDRTSWELQAAF